MINSIAPNPTTTLQSVIPAYAYREYQDDDNILILFEAINNLTQAQLADINSLNLPVYMGARIVGTLLDWVGQGLYSIPRPVIAKRSIPAVGPIDTWMLNQIPINSSTVAVIYPYIPLTDDLYKRVLTWHHYRADGKQFSIPWLKRRAARFLFGANGADVPTSYLQQVSVIVRGAVFTIGSLGADPVTLDKFNSLIQSGQLELPFQYRFVVNTAFAYNPAPLGEFILGENTFA